MTKSGGENEDARGQVPEVVEGLSIFFPPVELTPCIYISGHPLGASPCFYVLFLTICRAGEDTVPMRETVSALVCMKAAFQPPIFDRVLTPRRVSLNLLVHVENLRLYIPIF